MTQAVTDILTRVDRLSTRERAQVARLCLGTLTPAKQAPQTPAMLRATVLRRGAEIDSGTAKGQPAREAVAQLRKLLK